MVCRWFSATGSREASNSTEFHPLRRQSLMTSRSGQWSRWRLTGTSIPAVISRHMANSRSRPIDRTVLTEVWMMTGERSRTAAASTASIVRSLTMLIAGTPYRSAKARSTISLSETTGTLRTLRLPARARIGESPQLPWGLSLPRGLGRAADPGRELGPVAGAGLAQHRTRVLLDRLDREREPFGDDLVGQSLLHQMAHLTLAAGERLRELVGLQTLAQLAEHGPRQDGLPAGCGHDGLGQFGSAGVRIHAAAGPRPHRRGHLIVGLLVARVADADHSQALVQADQQPGDPARSRRLSGTGL